MAKYRKKPVVIEAYCYDQKRSNNRPDWFQDAVSAGKIVTFPDRAEIATLEGVMRADLGDWIIRGVKGELYPCKPDIFAATYEPVTPTTEAQLAARSGARMSLTEDDYEEIVNAATVKMRKAASGVRGQVITVQDSLDWWVMKETERRILSALAHPPAQAGAVTEVPGGEVNMTYIRVIPRDLFNEANLLKCYGRLAICLEYANPQDVHFAAEEVERFDVVQRPWDGSILIANLPLIIRGKSYALIRPLNSREPWPLYAEADDDGEPIAVFDKIGDLTDEMSALVHGSD